jgi:DNA replication licensing factor MCM4
MIRLAEAHAKMRFSDAVTVEDVREATRLVKMAIQTAATDPRTGLLDMDLVISGTSSGDRKRQQDLKQEIIKLLKTIRVPGARRGAPSGVRRSVVIQEISKQSTMVSQFYTDLLFHHNQTYHPPSSCTT